jgi:streptogrisin D
LAGTAMALPQAQAAAPPRSMTQMKAESLSAALQEKLGAARTAGSTFDPASGTLVVTVTDEAGAQTVRAAGATPKAVARSGTQLRKVAEALDRALRIPGTAWAVDPAANQVLLSVDSSVKGADLARVEAVAEALGSAVRVEHVAGTFGKRLSGGQAIYGSGYRCTIGFNARSGSTYYFLIAGHCGKYVSNWYSSSSQTTMVGTTAGWSFPGNDYGIARYTDQSVPPGNVDLHNGMYQDITSAGTVPVGATVCMSGSTSGYHCGAVTALNATVYFSEGAVSGLIKTTLCSEGGDSGAPVFYGSVAIGIVVGASGNCSSGGITYVQPIMEALSAYGVSVY